MRGRGWSEGVVRCLIALTRGGVGEGGAESDQNKETGCRAAVVQGWPAGVSDGAAGDLFSLLKLLFRLTRFENRILQKGTRNDMIQEVREELCNDLDKVRYMMELAICALSLISAEREVSEIHEFFNDLSMIITLVTTSSKGNDELVAAPIDELEHLVELNKVGTRTGGNKIAALQRRGDIR
ncbi:hypothetical protein AKJ16_DCAP24424 [Drosera capensis]